MLWNLVDLEPVEHTNKDYKQLIDNLRTYELLPYYISAKYRKAAQQELTKVDWDKQPIKTQRQYRLPIVLLKMINMIKKTGTEVKSFFN